MSGLITDREMVPTSALVEGDVVHHHGMRLVLGPVAPIPGHCVGAWMAVGTITNLAEVRSAGFVPASFIRDGRWIVQGNDRAYWRREVRS